MGQTVILGTHSVVSLAHPLFIKTFGASRHGHYQWSRIMRQTVGTDPDLLTYTYWKEDFIPTPQSRQGEKV